MTIKEMRKASGMTQAAFAVYIGIAKRTLEGWEHGRACPEYIRALIEYKMIHENIIKKDGA